MKARLAAGDYSVPAACLATVLDHFGRQLPLGVLADALGRASSVTASDMASVAEAQGLTSRVLSAVDVDFAAIATPAVVRISGGKWLVLLKYGHRRVAIANPTRGVQRMDTEEFRASVTEVIVLQPGEQFTRVSRPSLLGQLVRILPPAVVRGQIWILLLTLVSIVPVILVPLLLRSFVDLYLVAGISAVALQVLGAVILLAALQLGILWLQNWALVRGGAAVDISLMLAMARGIVYSPQRFRQQRSTYELATRTNEVQVLGQLVAGQLARGIAGILVFVAATALMFVLSPLLALLSTGILLVGLVVHRSLSAKALLSSQLGSVQRRQLHAEAGQSVDNFETLKSLGHTHVLFDRFGSRLAKAKTTMIRDDVEWQRPFTSWLIVTVGARLAILIVGAQLVLTDRTSIGTVVAIQALVGSQILPLLDLVQAQELMIKARSAVVALDDVTSVPAKGAPQSSPSSPMSARESEREGRLPVQSTLPSASVRFADLAFGYQPRRPLTIQDVSIDVAPGRRVAIVGPSGSGKSTIARILVGLLDPGAGDVDIGGRPRDSWPRSVSSHTVGYVSQDVSLFAGTIRDNVTMLDPRLSDEQVLRALQDAQILAEVQNRVGGLLHMVQDRGVGFSGGQIQRIGIARALVRDPRILVMDEATSALEPTTELLVDRAVRRRGCTTVVIAHRLSTVRDADEIIVVDRGQIVEQGTHDALIDIPGVYRRLVVG